MRQQGMKDKGRRDDGLTLEVGSGIVTITRRIMPCLLKRTGKDL